VSYAKGVVACGSIGGVGSFGCRAIYFFLSLDYFYGITKADGTAATNVVFKGEMP